MEDICKFCLEGLHRDGGRKHIYDDLIRIKNGITDEVVHQYCFNIIKKVLRIYD
jgi:hypothetical protein